MADSDDLTFLCTKTNDNLKYPNFKMQNDQTIVHVVSDFIYNSNENLIRNASVSVTPSAEPTSDEVKPLSAMLEMKWKVIYFQVRLATRF